MGLFTIQPYKSVVFSMVTVGSLFDGLQPLRDKGDALLLFFVVDRVPCFIYNFEGRWVCMRKDVLVELAVVSNSV